MPIVAASWGAFAMNKVHAPTPGSEASTTSAPVRRAPDPVVQRTPLAALTEYPLEHARPLHDATTGDASLLAQLRPRVEEAVAEELVGTDWTPQNCPWLDYWFSYYEHRSDDEIEAAMHKYAPATRDIRDAADFVPAVVEQVRRGVARWRKTGEIDGPTGIDAARGANGELIGDTGTFAVASLGEGQPLDGVSSSILSTLGGSVSDVQVHTGARAERLAAQADALAFTLGSHIVYGADAPRPGSLAGDALLAHELAHVQQQRGASPGEASVRESPAAEANADAAVAHAAASHFGLGNTLGRAWHAMSAPLGLQRCKSDLAKHKERLRQVEATLGSATDFATIGGAITEQTALEHWIAVLEKGKGPRTGTDAPEPGMPGCNCTTYVVDVLRETFKKVGRTADWKKVLEKTWAIKGKREVDGVELQSALKSTLGWKAIFWAPDPNYPDYLRYQRPGGRADPTLPMVSDEENKTRYDLATRRKDPVYRLYGKPTKNDIHVDQVVVNYAPEKAGRAITTPKDSTTVKDTTGLAKLVRIPFGVLTAKGGTHMALVVYGVVYEVHWSAHSNSLNLYAATPLEEFGWGSGIIVAPAEDVDRAFGRP